MALFSYTGTNPSDPGSYTPITSTPPTCLTPTQQMCYIEADADLNNKPILTEDLKDEMLNSLQNQVNGPNVHLKRR
ncbi:hypothetical protein HCX49_12655 [Sphingobacterium kitahiroshimense]|uniref:hypothetical protein n=1 Tax=Sphingobacterium sp. B16(2022) TaxID=2914044 RepID=UPI00143ABA8B|nr:hypothetical protein [Sphingobacterium sp. B16(2022)]NJI74054.1 hypothetical protein [Sphingobacterium sp. B16(2022)]